MPTEFEEGMLVGILVGEGHFGGDGRQPHVTLRMHQRHDALFRWIEHSFPGGRLYGPYDHGGRRYYQWMARGPYLRDVLLPVLQRRLSPEIDRYAHERFQAMCSQYSRHLSQAPTASSPEHRGTIRPEEARARSTPGGPAARRRAEDIFSDMRQRLGTETDPARE
jgi:hypothetical protein